MAPSSRIEKAVEQVKNNLHGLYFADYFTEEEWIQLDFAFNKGKYVFTDGPSANAGPPQVVNLLDEELMSFDEPAEQTPKIEAPENRLFAPKEEHKVVIPEAEAPTSGDEEGSAETLQETPICTSAEISSDDEVAPPLPAGAPKAGCLFDLAKEMNVPAPRMPSGSGSAAGVEVFEFPKRELKQLPALGGLALGYTKEQLEEAKEARSLHEKPLGQPNSFRPPQPRKALPVVCETTNVDTGYPSPTATEYDAAVNSWADSVPVTNAPSPMRPVISRSISRASNRSFTANPPKDHKPFLRDRIIPAKSISRKTKPYTINVHVGDSLKIISYLPASSTYQVEHMQTRKQGQVPSSVFEPPVTSGQNMIDDQRAIIKQRTASQSTVHSNRFGSVDFETSNAQEWDEVPVSRSRAVVKEPKPRTVGLGSETSRFAVLADEAEETCEETETAQVMSKEQKQQVSDLFDAKFEQILATQNRAPSVNVPRDFRHSRPLKKEATFPGGYAEKELTCWWWHHANHNEGHAGCRFSDEECFHLHDYPSGPNNVKLPINKNGKPTWTGLADAEEPEIAPGKVPKTCWFWAKSGKCGHTDGNCMFMHAYCSGGVAPRPRQWVDKWKGWTGNKEYRGALEEQENWRRQDDGAAEGPLDWAEESSAEWAKIEDQAKEARQKKTWDVTDVLILPPPSDDTW